METEAKSIHSRKKEAEEFKADYVKKASEVLPKPAVPARKVMPAHMTQKEAKRMLPGPVTTLWLSAKGAWCGHHPPNARISCPFNKAGSSEAALLDVVARLWKSYLESKGLGAEHCPYDNLFDHIIA